MWQGVTFRLQRHGSRMMVELDADGCTVTVFDGPPVPIEMMEGEARTIVRVSAGSSHRVPRSATAGATPG